MEPHPEFLARTKRVHDAVELKVPDRVPIIPLWGLLPAAYAGMTFEEAMYDSTRFFEASEKAILEYEPDLFYLDPMFTFPGKALEVLDVRQMKWPGHGAGANRNYQYIEREYMKEDEYDEFLLDPSAYLLTKFAPRIFGAFESFRQLPSPAGFLSGAYSTSSMAALVNPTIRKTLDSLFEAGEVANEWFGNAVSFIVKMAGVGFPIIHGASGIPPFDNLSMILRGSRGAMIDMYRRPDKLHAALEVIQKLNLPGILAVARETHNPRVSIFTYRGSDGFLSLEQFEEFYWPTAKELILTLIDEGLTPVIHFEGIWDQRLKYLAELPTGKILGVFERTDLLKAKEVLKGKMCFTGGMPISLIQTGTLEQIREHTRKSIETLGVDGGYIMAASTSFTDQVSAENMHAWIDATKEFGVY
jgi:uroporphyrinogen-III decarboxylase